MRVIQVQKTISALEMNALKYFSGGISIFPTFG